MARSFLLLPLVTCLLRLLPPFRPFLPYPGLTPSPLLSHSILPPPSPSLSISLSPFPPRSNTFQQDLICDRPSVPSSTISANDCQIAPSLQTSKLIFLRFLSFLPTTYLSSPYLSSYLPIFFSTLFFLFSSHHLASLPNFCHSVSYSVSPPDDLHVSTSALHPSTPQSTASLLPFLAAPVYSSIPGLISLLPVGIASSIDRLLPLSPSTAFHRLRPHSHTTTRPPPDRLHSFYISPSPLPLFTPSSCFAG